MRELLRQGFYRKNEVRPWSTARISEILRNPVYAKADIDIYNFFESQGANMINPASDYVGTNGIFLYKGINGDKTKKKAVRSCRSGCGNRSSFGCDRV